MPGACAAPNCKYNTRKLHVFRFPRDVLRCSQWLLNCNRTDLMEKSPKYLNTRCRLCEKHFDDDQFMNASKSRLVWKAVPTIFDDSDPPESEKRRKFKHSFLSAKRRKTATLGQSCSFDHTYFAALEKSALAKRTKLDPATNTKLASVCVMSENVTSNPVDTRNNLSTADLCDRSGNGTTAFKIVDTLASGMKGFVVDTKNMTSFCACSCSGPVVDNRNITGNAAAVDPLFANVTLQNCSSDANSNVVDQFNAVTNVITFYNSSIRNEQIEDDGCWITSPDFGTSSNMDLLEFQEEFSYGTGEGSRGTNSGVPLPPNNNLIAFCGLSSTGESLLAKQIIMPEMAGSVQHTTAASQKPQTTAQIPGAVDHTTAAAGLSRSLNVSARKKERRKAPTLEKAADSVDHTYAANILRPKSLQNEGDSSVETFSKEQGMLLVKKILSMQKEASAAAKRSRMKSEIPTVESVVDGAIKLGMKDSACRFFASQLRNCVRNNKGHRWSELDKTFARDLFVKSKEAYRVMEDFFYLPSAATLQRHARGLNVAVSGCEPSADDM